MHLLQDAQRPHRLPRFIVMYTIDFDPKLEKTLKKCLFYIYNLNNNRKKIRLNMARPIAETPILTGEDAIRFEKLRLEVENLSKEQRAENSRKLKEAVKKAKEYINICI